MSSTATRTRKKILRNTEALDPMYNTPFGTLITSIGILTGIDRKDLQIFYRDCEKKPEELPNTFKSMAEYIMDHFNVTLPTGSNLALFTDDIGRSPIVTPFYNQVLPLSPNGYLPFIVLCFLKDKGNVDMELIFDDEEGTNENDSVKQGESV